MLSLNRASVVQPKLFRTAFVAFLGWIRLKPLAEETEYSRNQIEGDDHQHDDEQTPRHRAIVTGEW